MTTRDRTQMHDSKMTGTGPTELAEVLRLRTRPLHGPAERGGIIYELLHARGTRKGRAPLLYNLLSVYRELERWLDRHLDSPGIRWVACRPGRIRSPLPPGASGLFLPLRPRTRPGARSSRNGSSPGKSIRQTVAVIGPICAKKSSYRCTKSESSSKCGRAPVGSCLIVQFGLRSTAPLPL
jgi:hypothetical protein